MTAIYLVAFGMTRMKAKISNLQFVNQARIERAFLCLLVTQSYARLLTVTRFSM